MKKLEQWQPTKTQIVLTDIDDTLTHDGRLQAEAYNALWQLHLNGILIVPVTGRPAGWCELIARQWPVAGVIGENGGFYFRYDENFKKMQRHFYFSQDVQIANRIRLDKIRKDILKQIPGARVASDQFTRLMDLAIDFCEDVDRLNEEDVDRIVEIFVEHGAQAKISSIHVNGWYGDYDKLAMTRVFLEKELGIKPEQLQSHCAFIGDSPNDEPMFDFFEQSFAVQNFLPYKNKVKNLPKFLCEKKCGHGFAEFANHLIATRSS